MALILYPDFRELVLCAFGDWFPSGGKSGHYASVVPYQRELLLVTGSRSGDVVVAPGQAVRFDDGKVAPSGGSYHLSDPIKGVLKKSRVRFDVLERTRRPLKWQEDKILSRSGDGSVDYYLGSLPPLVLGSAVTSSSPVVLRKSKTGRLHCLRDHVTEGGDALVLFSVYVRLHKPSKRKLQYKEVRRVLVRPGVDLGKVAAWLKPHVISLPSRF